MTSKILKFVICSLVFCSCYTSGDFTVVQKFNLKKGSRVAVRCNNDALNLVSIVENNLLIQGIEVVPYETALNASEVSTDVDLENNENRLKGNITSSRSDVTYIASTIVIDITYTFQYGLAASNITNMTAKIIDFKSKKLLALFSYRGGNFTTGLPDALAGDIVKKLSKYISDVQ